MRGNGAPFICAWKVMTFLPPFRGQANGNELPGRLGCSQKPGGRLAKRPMVAPLYFCPPSRLLRGAGCLWRGRRVKVAPRSALAGDWTLGSVDCKGRFPRPCLRRMLRGGWSQQVSAQLHPPAGYPLSGNVKWTDKPLLGRQRD